MFHLRIIYILVFIFFCLTLSHADMVVAPSDLDTILKKVSERQSPPDKADYKFAKIVSTDGRLSFVFPSEKFNIYDSFTDQSPDIIRHVQVKSTTDVYNFNASLIHKTENYQVLIRKINGVDALIFYNSTDVIVYTQNFKQDHPTLEQWVYARKPNSPTGSEWKWIFKSESWEWPMTMAMGQGGEVKVSRNLPAPPFLPIAKNAKSNWLLQAMVKFKGGDQIKNYFPFPEEVCSLPPSSAVNKEGVTKKMDVKIINTAIIKPKSAAPKAGLDFKAWDDYWQSVYTESIEADSKEYPLLIGPF